MRKYYLCNKGRLAQVWYECFFQGCSVVFMKMMTDYQTSEREKTVMEGNAKIT